MGLPAGEELLLEEENPGVLEDLDQRDSLIWVFLEELGDQVFVLLRNARLESNLRSCLIPSDGLLIAPKRCVSMYQFKEQDSQRPDIQLVVMLAIVDHFRCHILQSTAESVSLTFVDLAIVGVLREIALTSPAKVANFEHIILIDKQVFWL